MGRLEWSLTVLGTLVFVAPACDEGAGRATTTDEEDSTRDDADDSAEEGSGSSSVKSDAGARVGASDAGPRSVMNDAGKDGGKGMGSSDASAGGGKVGVDAGASDAAITLATLDGSSGEPPKTGTFPAVAMTELGKKGPYTAKTVSNTGPDGAYTLYHPEELGAAGALHPIVSWGNGGATTPVDYPMLPHLATHGFVVIASNNPLVQGTHVKSGIDWIVKQNEQAGSPFQQKLDTDNVAGVGYSNGGLATLAVADDPRFVTIVIISGANTSESSRTQNMPKLHTPVAYLCTDDDASKGNCKNDFDVAKVPAFFGVMKGSTHVSVTEFLGLGEPAIIDLMHRSTTGWLRWHQMADPSLRPMFVGNDCALCTDSKWTVQPSKGLDSLP